MPRPDRTPRPEGTHITLIPGAALLASDQADVAATVHPLEALAAQEPPGIPGRAGTPRYPSTCIGRSTQSVRPVTSSVRPAAIDRRPSLADALDLHRGYSTGQEDSRKQFIEFASGEDDVLFEPARPATSRAGSHLTFAANHLVPTTPRDNPLEFVEKQAEKPCSSMGDDPR